MKAICPRCRHEFNSSILFIDMDDKPLKVDTEYIIEQPVNVDCSATKEPDRVVEPGAVAWFLFTSGGTAAFKVCTDDDGGRAFVRFDANVNTGFAILPVRRNVSK